MVSDLPAREIGCTTPSKGYTLPGAADEGPAPDDEPWCGEVSIDDGLTCTRRPHDGDHVAHDTEDNVCGRWPAVPDG